MFVVGLPSRTDRYDGMTLSALSDLRIEFRGGVEGKSVPDRALLFGPNYEHMSGAVVGLWHAHWDAVQE